MKDIIHINNSEMTAEYQEALKTHQRIMANGEICAQSLLEICVDLKKMRDENLYEEFGYKSFDEYCEKMAGIKSRMAYNYISTYERLGSSVLQSNARLGITKLEMIAGMNPIERSELLANSEIENMSVSEIKALVKRSKEQGEQISFLKTQVAELQEKSEEKQDNAETEALRNELEQLKQELHQKDSTHEADIAAARKEAAEAARREAQEAVSSAGNDEAIQKKIDSAVELAKKQAAKEAKEKLREKTEAQAQKIKGLEAALTAAGTEKEKLEKQLTLSDTGSAKAMVYIQAIQDNFNSLFTIVSEMPDEQQNRFKGAVLKLVGAMQKKAEE